MMFDGGSVYTLGNQPGSALTRNHIYEQQHYFKGSALYHDQGSGGWLDKENVVHSLAGVAYPDRGPTIQEQRRDTTKILDNCMLKVGAVFPRTSKGHRDGPHQT